MLISSENDAINPPNLVANIVVAFAGTALGRVLGYGVLPALIVAGDTRSESVRVAPTKIFMCVMFALQIMALLAWFVRFVSQRLRERQQKGSGGQLSPAGANSPPEREG